jgi:glycosyltransferase involved in cell wall biosynthesis
MATPLVSVILPVHNREDCLARAIDSVLAQSYRSFELLVVDDGSTDGTRRVIERFGSAITIIEQAHRGPYVARNNAARRAHGELLAFIDSDDAWLPHLLEREVALMERPEVGLVFGDTIHVTAPRSGAPRTGLTSFRVSPPRRGHVAAHFAWCNFVPTVTALLRKRCFEEAGGFAESSEISSDYVMWYRVASRHEVDYVDEPVAEYTVHPAGISNDLGRAIETRIELFSGELERTTNAESRAILRRLLFNLSMSLVLATVRGKARSVSHPLQLASRTARAAAQTATPLWTAAFAMNQLRVRTQRLLS